MAQSTKTDQSEAPSIATGCRQIDLGLDLKDSAMSDIEREQAKTRFFNDQDGEEAYYLARLLEQDGSKQAAQVLYDIAMTADPAGEGSFVMSALARMGKAALPWIFKILTAPDPDRRLFMLDQLLDLETFKDVDKQNFLDFLKHLMACTEFDAILQRFEDDIKEVHTNDWAKGRIALLQQYSDSLLEQSNSSEF